MSHPGDPSSRTDGPGTRSFSGEGPRLINSLLETRDIPSAKRPVDSSTERTENTPTPVEVQLPPKYRYIGRLGRGGMGEVYQAFDTDLQRHVAIKFLRPQAATSVFARRRFLEEARVLAQLRHPNIVQVFDKGEWEGQPYFVMAYLNGLSLHERRDEYRISAARVVGVMATVAEGVQHAHNNGVYHRDLKASNVVLDDGQPVITDFGCARWDDGEISTQGFALLGTPSHMAPEVFEHGSKEHDARADLWALGVMLYHLLSGQLPFADDPRTEAGRAKLLADDPTPIRACPKAIPDVDDRLEAIVAKALAKNPAARYQTAAEFAAELRGWQALDPTESVVAGDARVGRRWVMPATLLGVVLVTACVGIVLMRWTRDDIPTTEVSVSPQVPSSVLDRLAAPNDQITFVGESGLPTEQVGPLPNFVGTLTTNADGKCEIGTAKLYFHELFRGSFPFPVRWEADVALSTPLSNTWAGLYAAEKRHSYNTGKPVHVAYLNMFATGERDPADQMKLLSNAAAAAGGKFAPPDGTIDANWLTQFVLVTSRRSELPPDPLDPHGRPGPVHHLVIEVTAGGFVGWRDGKRCGQLDPTKRKLETLLAAEVQFTPPTFGEGYGLFVRSGAAQFTNVRLTRLPPDN